MNKSQILAFFCVVLSSHLLLSKTAMARSAETEAKLKGALANFQAIEPEVLLDTKNVDLLQELKKLATNADYPAARVPLIKLGDETVIRSCLERLHSKHRKSAMAQLGMAGNPHVISLLASDFNREESANMIRVGYDLWILPVSMDAALITKRIILKSPVFTREVKEWAKGLPEVSPGLRSSIRTWWETNKAAITREDYQAVVPLP